MSQKGSHYKCVISTRMTPHCATPSRWDWCRVSVLNRARGMSTEPASLPMVLWTQQCQPMAKSRNRSLQSLSKQSSRPTHVWPVVLFTGSSVWLTLPAALGHAKCAGRVASCQSRKHHSTLNAEPKQQGSIPRLPSRLPPTGDAMTILRVTRKNKSSICQRRRCI